MFMSVEDITFDKNIDSGVLVRKYRRLTLAMIYPELKGITYDQAREAKNKIKEILDDRNISVD